MSVELEIIEDVNINENRLTMASRLMAGMLANPAVLQREADGGWGLNGTSRDLTEYAVYLANELIRIEREYNEY